MDGVKTYVAQRSKMFAAGLSSAIATAVLKHAEKSFGIELGTELEAYIVAGVVGAVTAIVTYWSPANAPMPEKEPPK